MGEPPAPPVRVIRREPLDSDAARALLERAEAELHARYPEDACHAVDLAADGAALYVAWLDSHPVGCGALRDFADESERTAEIKRMFVSADARGRGVGRALLRHLLSEARRLGYAAVFLETGTRQPEAIALYESEGFAPRPCDHRHTHPLSRCFFRRL
jgi:putative acetyltransferase